MANNKKGVLTTVLGAATAVVTAVVVFAKFVMGKLANFVVYFGLEIPLLYLLYGAILRAIFGFDIGAGDINATLYAWGLYVCLALCVVVTIRHIITPDGAKVRYVAKHTDDKDKPKKRRSLFGRDRGEEARREAPVVAPSTYQPSRYTEPSYTPPPVRVQPLVYRSRVNPELLIYEYPDRYDVYRDGRLHAIEYK